MHNVRKKYFIRGGSGHPSSALALLTVGSNASADDGWGTLGENISWHFYEASGVLELTGTGEMIAGSTWSQYTDKITSVKIGEGITYLAKGACNSSKVTSVEIPSTVTAFGNYAFEGSGITSIDLSHITQIGEYCFSSCKSLTSVVIPGTITTVPSHAFYGCTSLADITLSEGITSLGSYSLAETAISGISIPSSVTTISSKAFLKCNKLVNIEIPATVTSVGNSLCMECDALRYVSYNASGEMSTKTFCKCNNLSAVRLGNQVTSIGFMEFWGDNALTHVFVPASVASISDNAFYASKRAVNLAMYAYPDSAAYNFAGENSWVSFVDVSTCQTADWERRFQQIDFGTFSALTAQSFRRKRIQGRVTAHFPQIYFSRGSSPFEIRLRISQPLYKELKFLMTVSFIQGSGCSRQPG